MKIFYRVRLMLLALVVALIPASSFSGVFISVGFAPPILPVYEQPPCPEQGLMWAPGYWAYGGDGYYWVPGTWVPAPYEGALWTPPYWGWEGGLYMFHPGYWGRHVGYYGGVNYGFGYMGVGFAGGMWRGRDFVYNTAVMRVDDRMVHNTYVDREIVQRETIGNEGRVAFSGGPGGIRHDPAPEERFAEREQHVGATSFQSSHESSAMRDRGAYFKNNGGRPSNGAVARPIGGGMSVDRSKSAHDDWSAPTRTQNPNGGENQGRGNYAPPNGGNAESKTYNASHSNTGNAPAQPAPQGHPAQQYRQAPQPVPHNTPQAQPHPAPQAQPHPAPQAHNPPPAHGDSKDHQH
jgi:hypothetical protein